MKVLNATYMMHDITVDQFDDVVTKITIRRYLRFNEVKLPTEGTAHNKAFHISITWMDTLLSRVLVDTGSLLNVMPKNTLSQLMVEGYEMGASALVVRAFYGTRRQVIGEIGLSIHVGPYLFTITFHICLPLLSR